MPTDSSDSPLTLAAFVGNVDLVSGANIEEVNSNGHTPLMEAASKGYEVIVMRLLHQGMFVILYCTDG